MAEITTLTANSTQGSRNEWMLAGPEHPVSLDLSASLNDLYFMMESMVVFRYYANGPT